MTVLPELLFAVRETASAATLALTSAASVTAATREGAENTPAASILDELGSADIVVLLLTISVVLRVLNFHFTRVPSSVAMAFGSILLTIVLLVLSHLPMLGVEQAVDSFRAILKDFPDLLLNYMLGFLMFAGAMEVDLRNLGRIRSTIIALSIVSTCLSTMIIAVLTYLLMLNIAPMEFKWCLLFGAIVSPTDPITCISIVNINPSLLPASTRYFVMGEALLNDAVGVVLYLTLMEIVTKPDIGTMEVLYIVMKTICLESASGIAMGIFLAWLAYSAIASVKEPLLEVVITFVLVGNINMIGRILEVSIPLASVSAGLFIGNYAVEFAMFDETVESFHEMWKLADETLNSILFLMVGAADLIWNPQELGLTRAMILVVCVVSISMISRIIAVALPLLAIISIEWLTGKRLRHESVRYRGGTIAVLTWAGMRGGISIALALGVPDSFVKHAVPGHMTYGQLIFFMTFIIVVFSICVQGMLFEPVIKMINRVSYEIMPSGGLGTYVSTMSLGNGYNELGEFEENSAENSTSSVGERIWDASAPIYGDYDANAPIPPTPPVTNLLNQDPYSFQPDVQPDASEGVMRRAVTMAGEYPPDAMRETKKSHSHERQGSLTFQDLTPLEKLPSIPAFLGDLRRKGTDSFVRWFDVRGNAENSESIEGSSALSRSHTVPNNARLARGERSSSDDGYDDLLDSGENILSGKKPPQHPRKM